MTPDEDYLDCCTRPDLEAVKTIYSSSHDSETVRQCRNCGRYWFHRFHEYVSFDGPDDITVWDSPLTMDEAQSILGAEGRPDLSFLKERPSFMSDRNG